MKKSIKMLAIVLSVLMIVSIMPTISFASGSVSTFVGTIDFEDLTVGTTYTASDTGATIYAAGSVPNNSSATVTLNKVNNTGATIAAGGNGKAANDQYLSVNSAGTTQVWVNGVPDKFVKGEQYRFSFDYLPLSSPILSGMRPQAANNGSGAYISGLFSFSNTAIVINETSYDVTDKNLNKWSHIDIVLTVGDGATGTIKDTFTTYLNGELLGTVDWDYYCQNGKTLGRWDFCGKIQNLDNISITSYTGGATFAPAIPSLISGGADISKGYTGAELYVANKTVSQTIAGLGSDANVKNYSAVDANGTAVAESTAAAGNTLVITDINDVVYYVPMVGNTLQKTATGTSGLTVATGAIVAEDTDFYGADTSWKFSQNDVTTNLSLYPTYETVPMYVRIPLLVEESYTNDILYITGRPTYNNGASYSGGHRIVKLEKGKVYIDNGTDSATAVATQIGTYNRGEWFVIEIALLPGQSYFTVRINDGEVYTGRLGIDETYFEDFSKNGYFQLSLPKGNDPWHFGAIDLYTGVPTDVTAPSLTAVPAGTTLTGNAITVPYGKDASAYITGNSITASNAPTVKFIGADGKSIATGYNGGKMVLISADGIYKYFTLNAREKACTLMSEDAAGNKTYWVDLTTNDGSITPVIYSALFNGNLLSSVSTISIGNWILNNTTFEFTVAPHTGSTTRKIMIWDKTTLVPLAGTLN